MIRQFELVERVKTYDPKVDEAALNRAYVFSMKAHGAQKRDSGDPYFSHPIEVAGILTELKLDSATIVTALLHDTVEDTLATLPEIEALFGKEVSRLVDGVTKLSRLELQTDDARQAENFRKLLLATSEDIRVLLIKLADRLHNMRTLHHVKSAEKRTRTARETMEIYAPLAERIGMQSVKDELEDLAFGELNAAARESIVARLAFLREHGENVVPRIVAGLEAALAAAGIKAEISGREKRCYSIWRKMQRKNVDFERLSDVMAFRLIVGNLAECYRALGVIHTKYVCVPGRFKDYISIPKLNGYRSLHTAVFGPENRRIEIQIRTPEMNDVAEFGVAAHWQHKSGAPASDANTYRWLRGLLDILDQAAGPEEFLENTKLEMFQDQVFCFTPKGDLIALPKGATPVDFAYAVHSEVGDFCVGAKINSRLVPLRTPLNNGDQIEIITSKTGTPSPSWERFVVTGKARARIRRFVRSRQRGEYLRLGQAMLQKSFRDAGRDLGEDETTTLLATFDLRTPEDLYVAVGHGNKTCAEALAVIVPGYVPAPALPLQGADGAASGNGSSPMPIPIRGLIPGMAVHISNCCHPLPGDRIVGIVTQGKGVAVHTIDCQTLESFHDQPERWVDIGWDLGQEVPRRHVGRVSLIVANERGSLARLSTVIANNEGNINNLKIVNRAEDLFEMVVDIEVHDAKHLSNIVAALRSTPGVNSVERAHG